MARLALGIEYDGGEFAGWQLQANSPSVQVEVERALSLVADHPVEIHAAGRTDAGVHAAMQVAHFDTAATRSERGWILGANTNLPDSISVLWARPVPDDFHSRHNAISRSYRYIILNRWERPSLQWRRVCWLREPLDEARMHAAAQHLLGEHDFSSFRAAECQSPTPMRRVHRITVARRGDYVTIDATANAFLHHMVRNIAGVLLAVGRGKHPVDWPREVLQARDRTQGGITAPAGGLYFVGVEYPQTLDLPSAASPNCWPMALG